MTSTDNDKHMSKPHGIDESVLTEYAFISFVCYIAAKTMADNLSRCITTGLFHHNYNLISSIYLYVQLLLPIITLPLSMMINLSRRST